MKLKLSYFVGGLLLVLVTGTFLWLAFTDVNVTQTQTVKTIENGQFFNAK